MRDVTRLDILSALLDADGPLAWQDGALCAQTDPEAFFPEKGGSTREAKKVCTSCDVRAECLDYAIAHDERFGIWGGLSERERRKLRRTDVDPPSKPVRAAAVKAYRAGSTGDEVAARFGVTATTVYRWVKSDNDNAQLGEQAA